MTKPLALQGDYVDLKFIRTRSMCQMVIEFDISHGEEIVQMFGTPKPATGIPVAVAHLSPERKEAAKPDADPAPASGERKRHFSEMPLSQQSALACERPDFVKFLRKEMRVGFDVITCEEDAANVVRDLCHVESRSEFDTDPEAANRWRNLYGAFEAERLAEAHGRR